MNIDACVHITMFPEQYNNYSTYTNRCNDEYQYAAITQCVCVYVWLRDLKKSVFSTIS